MEGDDELDQHVHNCSVPFDVLATAGCGVEDYDEDYQRCTCGVMVGK